MPRPRTNPQRVTAAEFAAAIAEVEALTAEWTGPGPKAPHAVAHEDERTGQVTFHLHGFPEQLAHIRDALRAYRPQPPAIIRRAD